MLVTPRGSRMLRRFLLMTAVAVAMLVFVAPSRMMAARGLIEAVGRF